MNRGQLYSKFRAKPRTWTRGANDSRMNLDQGLGDRHAQAQTTIAAGNFRTLFKWLEQSIYHLRCHADAVVFEGQNHAAFTIISARNGNVAMRPGELRCVIQDITKDL